MLNLKLWYSYYKKSVYKKLLNYYFVDKCTFIDTNALRLSSLDHRFDFFHKRHHATKIGW